MPYFEGGVGVRVVVGKVADIVLVLKGHSEGHGVVRLALLAPRCNRAPGEVVPENKTHPG